MINSFQSTVVPICNCQKLIFAKDFCLLVLYLFFSIMLKGHPLESSHDSHNGDWKILWSMWRISKDILSFYFLNQTVQLINTRGIVSSKRVMQISDKNQFESFIISFIRNWITFLTSRPMFYKQGFKNNCVKIIVESERKYVTDKWSHFFLKTCVTWSAIKTFFIFQQRSWCVLLTLLSNLNITKMILECSVVCSRLLLFYHQTSHAICCRFVTNLACLLCHLTSSKLIWALFWTETKA
jgi:hypothetical protein